MPEKPTAAKKDAPLSETRLYIGNLDPSVDEYTILKLFEPLGRIKEFNFLFHQHGPKSGQPRGYCFLEYESPQATWRAIRALHNYRLKNRPLVVSTASVSI
ncbi:hypothetical protein BJ085DRAFT_24787 [Dimargaris cristalligena]|uniref:RRM domain-containing protein n=1 Tax=Dimargaris cristalligena TaxID=215637 RepID=A0A4P9ZWW0_9FUNG|nr:hypothetical protein BJ085DRAFT_24787 [Dimargaris cristalligena]|eukprot:RKP37352.1 hypothetical protein BJ085DRAFT_24787 [Dimargaris cristalligena]